MFELGHLNHARDLILSGAFDEPVMVQLCLGVPGAAPATPEALMAMKSLLPADKVVWSAFGVGAMQMPVVAQAVASGGNVRVGLEDNIYLSKGVLATNAQLVERAKTIIESLGSRVLTAAEARVKLGLNGRGCLSAQPNAAPGQKKGWVSKLDQHLGAAIAWAP